MSAARRRAGAARYAAPVAFLLAVTIAVLLVRAGLRSGGSTGATTAPAATRPAKTTAKPRPGRKQGAQGAQRFYTVGSGDTFGSIAAKTGVSVAQIERLNPGVSSNALHVGQKLRVK